MIEWLIFLAKLRNKEKKLIIQNPVNAESSFITESNLIQTPLPALYKRGIAKMLFLSFSFLVIHHFDVMKRIVIGIFDNIFKICHSFQLLTENFRCCFK